MRAVCKRAGGKLFVSLSGEIDQHSADELRSKLDRLIDDPAVKRIEFELGGVSLVFRWLRDDCSHWCHAASR